MTFNTLFQNCAKLSNIPLTLVNLINQPTADILIDELESLQEGAARGQDTQVVVEHQKRIANRIDNSVRESRWVRNSCE